MFKVNMNDVVEMKGKCYRAVAFDGDVIVFVEIDTDMLSFLRINEIAAKALMNRKEMVLIRTEPPKLSLDMISDEEKDRLLKLETAIKEFLAGIYPNYERLQAKVRKTEYENLERRMGLSHKSARKWVRRYLQSGGDIVSLIDLRVQNQGDKKIRTTKLRGAKPKYYEEDRYTAEHEVNGTRVEDIFEMYFQLLLSQNEKMTITGAYERMVMDFFGSTVMAPPSYRRFYYFCTKRLAGMNLTYKRAMLNERADRNNNRFKAGNAQSGVYYPGQMIEIDALEANIMIVSSDGKRNVVGKPIVYMAIDVFSGCIVAISIAFDNNSYIGLSNLMFSMLWEHDEEAKKYNVEISPAEFPSCFVPVSARVDRGAEYLSDDMARLIEELGFNVNYASPATGSLKGTVERSFREFENMLRDGTMEMGAIYQGEYNPKHKRKAALTIDGIRSFGYKFVQYYNNRERKDYPYTKEMIEEMKQGRMQPCSKDIWNYGIRHIQSPRKINDENRDRQYFSLLKKDIPFRLTDKGITAKGLYYVDPTDWMTEQLMQLALQGKNSKKLSGIRYDPRSVDKVYRLENNRLVEIPLNLKREEQKTFLGLTWKTYLELVAAKKESLYTYKSVSDQYRFDTKKKLKEITEESGASAKASKRANNVKDIKENRAKERDALLKRDTEERENRIFNKKAESKTEETGKQPAVVQEDRTGVTPEEAFEKLFGGLM